MLQLNIVQQLQTPLLWAVTLVLHQERKMNRKQHKSRDGLSVYTFLTVMNALIYLNGYNNLCQIPNLPFLSKSLTKNVIHI